MGQCHNIIEEIETYSSAKVYSSKRALHRNQTSICSKNCETLDLSNIIHHKTLDKWEGSLGKEWVQLGSDIIASSESGSWNNRAN